MHTNMIFSTLCCGFQRIRLGFFIFILLIPFGFALSPALAGPSTTTLKLVFPFGDPKSQSICPMPQRTLQGCCSEAKNVYDYSGKKACCSGSNELMTYGQDQTCCAPWKAGQNRWGQTPSSPCGGYCPPVSRMVSAGGYSSCCTDCALVDGVRAFETAPGNVCGTCCSRIPESCGNAGVRVCSSGTGSAYCSKLPDKCNDQDDWLIGSHGEGGYTCCAKCGTNGIRYNSTNSDCGACCLPPNLTVSYQGATSCCANMAPGQNRWGQTTSSVCGGYCGTGSSVYSYSGYSSCCKTCSEVLAFQSGPGNVCGTCCSAIPNNCGTAGTRVCESATGSAYCSKDPTKCTPATDWTVGTSGEGGYSCCASCAGIRYNHTESNCGTCCATPSQYLTVGTGKSCCASCANGRVGQTATNVCGTCCAGTNQAVTFGGNVSCCAACNGQRFNQTAANICGLCGSYCSIGTSGTATFGNVCGGVGYYTMPGYGKYRITYVEGAINWDTRNRNKWNYWANNPFYPGCQFPGYGGCGTCGKDSVQNGMKGTNVTCSLIPATTAHSSMISWGFTCGKCGLCNGSLTVKWECIGR